MSEGLQRNSFAYRILRFAIPLFFCTVSSIGFSNGKIGDFDVDKLRFFILIFFISLLLYGAPSLSNSNALIPLKVLFGNPEKVNDKFLPTVIDWLIVHR